jgi:hypothetical protein
MSINGTNIRYLVLLEREIEPVMSSIINNRKIELRLQLYTFSNQNFIYQKEQGGFF